MVLSRASTMMSMVVSMVSSVASTHTHAYPDTHTQKDTDWTVTLHQLLHAHTHTHTHTNLNNYVTPATAYTDIYLLMLCVCPTVWMGVGECVCVSLTICRTSIKATSVTTEAATTLFPPFPIKNHLNQTKHNRQQNCQHSNSEANPGLSINKLAAAVSGRSPNVQM